MSANCTRHNHQHSPHITSPQVTAADPLRKRIESPTAVHEFADEASVVTETSSDGSSLELCLAPHDAISIPSSREEEDEEEAYHDYFTRMSRLIEKAHPVRGTYGSIVDEMEVQPTTNDAPIAETTTADGIPMERQHPEDVSKCCQLSSQCCGMTDDPLHETLFPSPEWFCCQRLDEQTIDPIPTLDESSAAILIQSKWRSFIAVKHYATTLSSVLVFYELGPSQQVVMEEEAEATLASSAIVIQSRWRAHAASRRYARMLSAIRVLQSFVRRMFVIQPWRRIRRDVNDPQEGIRDILLEDKRERAATLFQSIVRRRLVLQKIENARQFHGQVHPPVVLVTAAESAVIKCQSAIRRWMVVRQMREWRGSTRCSYPNKMHVAQTGHIELILNDTSETADETFTAYSEVSHASWEEEEEEDEEEEEETEEEEEEEDETSCCPSKTDNSEAQIEQSRCGLSDNVHEMLIQSGKWIYDRVGDPNVDTAHDLLTIMEISEEVVFCCGARLCCK
ncbi:hypothetical protein HJC23_013693 [Cyclotella cryptica]|uniref:Uncharacterized protein n=1 Tax=Cyclotella cryptica TaxID=29204 RepID=A0ABD3QUV9_9STRA|eukprot:CCRYP_001544-RA/>CCRYP_001544-RA protein AED:0.12 eAED:0.12 QI:0/-1/0/1/-1/1/1/0/507